MNKLSQPAPEFSAPKLVEELIRRAENAGASDIHLQMIGRAAQVSFRLDGLMAHPSSLPEEIAERVFGRIKFLAKLKTYQDSLPQDGRIEKSEVGARNDIRVATYPTVTGEKIVLRLFTDASPRSLRELELPGNVCEEIEKFLHQSAGLMLLTGPAGSGKTTTIYGCLRYLAGLGGRHIITVEDPVEQILPGIMQTEVNEARGLTFAKAARHLLRQDPQVLVLGEIRDEETANLVVRAALTGHQVISTLHAGSCQGVFERLLVMCSDQYAVLSAIDFVLNQRLMRRLCQTCRGSGCEACLHTGYHGRIPVVEWIRVNDALRKQLLAQGTESAKPAQAIADSARSLWEQGVTNQAEYCRMFGP